MVDCKNNPIKVGDRVMDLPLDYPGTIIEIRKGHDDDDIASIKLDDGGKTSRYSYNVMLMPATKPSSKIEKVCCGCKKNNDMDVKVCWWCGGAI